MTRNDTHDADVAFIRALAELLRENDLTELHVKRDYSEEDSLNVRVSRDRLTPPSPPCRRCRRRRPRCHRHRRCRRRLRRSRPLSANEPDDPANHPGAITSPMVGTVYLQAEPGGDPFVKVGDAIAEGQTLLIVEAMKTMNHIPAPRSGTVRSILVEDGAPVEYGAPLLIVD